MMGTIWNSTLTRKTRLQAKKPMNRGKGFERPKQGSKNWNGAAGPAVKPKDRKPKKKRKLPKESPEHKAYRESHDECELIGEFPKSHPIHRRRKEEHERVPRRDQIHHILWGSASRKDDIPTNLIRVCATVHDWIHANRDDGMALCLFYKLKTGELDWKELERIGKPKKFPSYIETLEVKEDWIRERWLKLIDCPEVP